MLELVKVILAWASESEGNGFALFVISIVIISLTYHIVQSLLATIKAFAPRKGK